MVGAALLARPGFGTVLGKPFSQALLEIEFTFRQVQIHGYPSQVKVKFGD